MYMSSTPVSFLGIFTRHMEMHMGDMKIYTCDVIMFAVRHVSWRYKLYIINLANSCPESSIDITVQT